MEEKDSYAFHFHQTPQIWEAEVVRILDFCQVHVRDSRISLLQQSQEQAVPKLYTRGRRGSKAASFPIPRDSATALQAGC